MCCVVSIHTPKVPGSRSQDIAKIQTYNFIVSNYTLTLLPSYGRFTLLQMNGSGLCP